MRKHIFLALVLINLQITAMSQDKFAEAMSVLEANPKASIEMLLDVITDPKYQNQLNPKTKTGIKNLLRVLDEAISFTNNDWLKAEQISVIFEAFTNQGMDFAVSEKGAVSNMVLQKYVYAYDYKYQNVGLLIYKTILYAGYDPYNIPDKNGQSMFGFAISNVASGSYYFDELIDYMNMNMISETLGMSPFIWLATQQGEQPLSALKHLILYDKDLNINERTESGKTSAFDRAIALNNTDLATLLIEGGIDLNAVCNDCAAENYLHRIALYNSISVFKLLPEAVVEGLINQPDVNGKTPIFWALENESAALAIAFAQAGADLKYINKDGDSVLEVAGLYAEANKVFILAAREMLGN